MARAVTLIVNPSAGAGRAERVVPQYEAELRRLGLDVHTERTEDIEHARALATEVAATERVAVAVGGDGLVGAVGGALADAGGLLGILPGGRGNDFARTLGIPNDVAAACAIVAEGPEHRLDLGTCGDRTFVGIASCGFDSDANRIANEAKLIKGNLVYAYAALRALASWKPATFSVTLDGEERTFTGFSVAAANAKAFGGGMFIAPDAELDDGLLDVVVISGTSKRRYVAGLPSVFKGEHVSRSEVSIIRAREVTIRADRPFTAYADGDPIGDLPLTIRARQSALRTIVPA
jgi:YegS/Rv2252/BmrU family lipid kinase